MNGILQARIEKGGGAAEHACAQRVEISLSQIGKQHDHRQAEKSCDIAARDYPIVHLQHIKGAGEHQQVDDATEQGDAGHPPRAFAQAPRNGIITGNRRERSPRRECLGAVLSDTHPVRLHSSQCRWSTGSLTCDADHFPAGMRLMKISVSHVWNPS